MNKTIIHSKIQIDDRGYPLIPFKEVANIANNMKEMLGEDYILIFSPFETNKIEGDDIVINIDCRDYSYNELMEIIEKASMYDGLCK